MGDERERHDEVSDAWWRRHLMPLAVAGGLVALVLFYAWWSYAAAYESTENAYVEATSALVSPQVAGRVEAVLVASNRFVETGDLLVRLDASNYRIALTRAQAEVARARSRLEAARVSVDYNRDRTDANVDEAEAHVAALQLTTEAATSELARRQAEVVAAGADLDEARQDLERIRTLHDRGAVSRRELDHAVSSEAVQAARLEVARAAVRAQEQQITVTEQQLEEAAAQVAEARAEHLSTRMKTLDVETLAAELEVAEAALDKARLDLEHSAIRAPIDGFVSRKSVEVGNFVQPGQALMAIVALDRAWVEANFKEDQIEHIRIGQPATIVADAYPDHEFAGHVDSLSSGTGDAFSLLPPVNATGNWIKVTRRVPVKIVLDQPPPAEHPLRIGMTTTVTVDVRDQSGPRLLDAHDPTGDATDDDRAARPATRRCP